MELYEFVYGRFERFCKVWLYGVMEFCDLMYDVIVVVFEKLREVNELQVLLIFFCGIVFCLLVNQCRKINESGIGMYILILVMGGLVEVNMVVVELYCVLFGFFDLMSEVIIFFEIMGFFIREIVVMQYCLEDVVKQWLKCGWE